MKNKQIKNTALLSAITTGLLLASGAFAASPVPSPAEINMVQQLRALNTNVKVVGNRMTAIAEANAKARNSDTPNQSLIDSMLLNSVYAKNQDKNQANNDQLSEQFIQSQLQVLPDNLAETGSGMINSTEIEQRLKDDLNLKYSLTALAPASDSVYSNDPAVLSLVPTYQNMGLLPPRGLAQPKTEDLNDDYFNFNSLIEPLTLPDKSPEAQAAQSYITYLTKSYDLPTDAVDFKSFKQKLSQAKDATDKMSLYTQLLNDQNYRDYQLNVRSSIAAKSVAVSNFEHMIAERTPIKDLGKQSGLVDKDGKPVDDASPLQVEKYLANRRVDNPKWYAHVQSESAANVQRETLVVLAEIEAQNYQAHMDRERLLATISAQTALGNAMANAMNQAKSQDLNQDISKFTMPSQQQEQDEQNKKNSGN